MATTAAPDRIVTLDTVRGVAVMGILAMNIAAFALPEAAYVNPAAYGTEGPGDLIAWLVGFLFFDGRMRGLFSFLFGASMLLVIERAEAGGRSPAAVHYARMAWLLVFGLIHLYLIWYGDILSLYAPVGMIAFAWRRASLRALVGWGVALLIVQFLLFGLLAWQFQALHAAAAAPGASPDTIAGWMAASEGLRAYTPAELAGTLALHRGSWTGIVHHMLTDQLTSPLQGLFFFGWETLGYMLLGMAALRSGFLTGAWRPDSYRRIALLGFAVGLPAYALFAWLQYRSGFAPETFVTFGLAATVPFRPLMILASAALVIQLTRGGGPLNARIAAAGRAAFTNYLGTSILMTFIFYGWGLGWFGYVSRLESWAFVVGAWAVMLLWSKPWLDRFHYGPFEWLWRSLARGRPQPMLRRRAAAAPALR